MAKLAAGIVGAGATGYYSKRFIGRRMRAVALDREENFGSLRGTEGTVTADDIGLRISADADGEAALGQAMTFARELSATIGR